jgi:flavin-dependent dehydrogenase
MSRDFDVAVVGAGPAGSTAARTLASAGRRVVLIEKDTLPRQKLCGEFLSAEAVARLSAWGLRREVARLQGEEIRAAALFGPRRCLARFPLPSTSFGVSRLRLDQVLAEAAEAAGAEVRTGCRVERIQGRIGETFELQARDGTMFRARAVVAAWGRSRAPLEEAKEPVRKRRRTSFGWKRHLRGDSAHLAGRVHLYLFEGGYCGLSRVEDGVVNFAGIASEVEIRHSGRGWQGFTERLVERHAPLRRHLAGLVPDGPFVGGPAAGIVSRRPLVRGIFAAGDAAGERDPFTGDGQATALAAGRLAAEILDDFLLGRVSAIRAQREYARRWSRLYKRSAVWDRAIRIALSHPQAARLLSIAPGLGPIAFRRTRVRGG